MSNSGDWAPLTPAQQRAKDDALRVKGEQPTLPPAAPAHIPGASAPPPQAPPPRPDGEAVEVPEITGAHLAEIRAEGEGFTGQLDTRDGPLGNTPMPATPQEAITIIETLTNEKIRLETERDAAIDECQRYYEAHGPAPERNGGGD
jgi:hypothetical protein